MGNINGTTCAYWGHALSVYLINIYPFKKDTILHETGEKIAVPSKKVIQWKMSKEMFKKINNEE